MHAPVSNKAMSQRQTREERRLAARNLAVTSKCLAIVLLPQKKQTGKHSEDVVNSGGDRDGKKCPTVGSTAVGDGTETAGLPGVGPTGTGAAYSGKTLLDDFKQQNRTCYWNPALIESIRQLEYLGFVEPCTVLVGGEEIHLENLRSAWGRRVLKAPTGFTIDRIGDVNGIEMQVIPQTQFIPLPDSLCLIITELNNSQQAATLDSIRARLQRWYQNTALPTHQLIYDTLGQLIRERKVFHNGSGYCVVTPETYHLPTADPSLTCTASWLPYHPMYIPVFPQQQQQPAFRAPTRSISCQVTQIEEKLSSEGSVKQKTKARHRSHSVRACRGKDKAAALAEKENAEFRRTMSVKYKAEKAKALSKDLNLKTGNIHQVDKEKGEKVSLFSKIFGRKKKKLVASGATTASTSSGGGTQSNEVEYATFSAQFPPPEWVWYQQQLERHRRTEEWVSQQTAKPGSWQHFSSTGAVASSAGADSGNHDMTLTESSHPHTDIYNTAKSQHGHVYATLGVLQATTESGGVQIYSADIFEKRGHEDGRRQKQLNRLSGSHAKTSQRHAHHHHHHHKQKEHKKTLHENDYDVPLSQAPSHLHGNTNMDITPFNIDADGVYATPGPSHSGRFAPWHSTPCYDVPPSQLDSHAMPSNIVYNSTQAEQSDAVKPHHHRRSHRSKRRGHRAYSYYDTGGGNDISIEYKGRMPKKNSSVAQSRDSGVNCMGLPQSRQVYMNQPDPYMTQESIPFMPTSAADQPTLTTTATPTASSLQPHTVSTQRGTPYTSMDNRNPEGSSGDHNIIINDLSTDMADTGTVDAEHTQDGGANSGQRHEGSAEGQDGGAPRMEDRSECEGLSQDLTPHFVAMSYCDSSIGDEGAGAGEVILCQAEINQFQIPQLVLDTEPQGNRNNLGSEPDVALSSGGSKDTLDRTVDESERSAETVIRSPKAVADGSVTSHRSSESAAQHSASGASNTTPICGGEADGEDENRAVNALGHELQEMGVVDSGFSSPRNTDNKENQQQQPAASGRPPHHKNNTQHGRGQHHVHHGNEAGEGNFAVPEHKSKHERIKAFVKQSNQLLEQRQFSSHGHNNGMYSPDMDGFPTCHPHHHAHQHYAPVPKPFHPIQHHHQAAPPSQQQQQQPAVMNNQRHHHHGRPHSMHGGTRERPRSQNQWLGGGGDKVAPSDLQAFQQQQLSNQKFGLNGEFEVVGVV